jgi:hypothetical protein
MFYDMQNHMAWKPNRVVSTPKIRGDAYAVRAPRWLTYLLRIFSVLFAFVAGAGLVRNGVAMPDWVRITCAILMIAFLFMAISKRGWSRLSNEPFFIADASGMYFPSVRRFELNGPQSRWLLIPWSNISSIRVDRAITSEGRSACAAFDVVATAKEVEEFLFDALVDKASKMEGARSVAFYVHAPPSASRVVAELIAATEAHIRSADGAEA